MGWRLEARDPPLPRLLLVAWSLLGLQRVEPFERREEPLVWKS